MEEGLLINDVLLLAEQVRQRPVALLLPHSDQIRRLYTTIDQLHRSVTENNGRSSTSAAQSLPLLPLPDPGPVRIRGIRSRRINAECAIQAASTTALLLTSLIREHFSASSNDWFVTLNDPRAIHLQPILNLQRATTSVTSDAQDRLLLACSCHSIATDFDAYEQSQGWMSKQQSLFRRLLDGQDMAIQKHSRHHQSFLATLDGGHIHREKFDAGLRLGTKMRLIQACGDNAGIGIALGLLLGYECHKLSRLPYEELPAFFALLQQGGENLTPITEFCNEFDGWWRHLSERYHSLYGQHHLSLVRSEIVATNDSHIITDDSIENPSTRRALHFDHTLRDDLSTVMASASTANNVVENTVGSDALAGQEFATFNEPISTYNNVANDIDLGVAYDPADYQDDGSIWDLDCF